MLNNKERAYTQENGLLPHKIAESDTAFLGHYLCAFGGSIYNKDTIYNSVSFTLLTLTMIDPSINTGWYEIVEATNKSATSIQDLLHNIWLVRYPRTQFIVFDIAGKFETEFK
jgi:hypothetical protein